MVATTWKEVGRLFPAVLMGDFVVMPDHLHAILTLGTSYTDNHEMELASIVGWFKTVTVKRYGHGVKTLGWLGYSKPLWQRSFHDHIVRDDADSLRCEQYIEGNPARWAAAREHEME
jgi:REP element-mobilizing transposase RayT